MFQTVSMWNMTRPDMEMGASVGSIKLRGYNADPAAKVFLTGEFASRIANKEIKALSVGDIADRQCPTRKDVYYKKGVGKLRQQAASTWGSIAGHIAEGYATGLFLKALSQRNSRTYQGLRGVTSTYSNRFQSSHSAQLNKLSQTQTHQYEDPDWLLKMLSTSGRADLGIKILHSHIFDKKKDVDFSQLELNSKGSLQLRPNPREVGISTGVEPDFVIKKCRVIGDIKSGINFEEYYLLTCAGYALAYENEKGPGHEIDWGIIYFIPTRYPTDYVKPITSSQVYIFPVDDNLRRWFLTFRNQDYSIISNSNAPGFPGSDRRQHCSYCRFREQCKSEGLTI